MEKKTKRPRKPKAQMQGLGDLVEKVTEVTGIKDVVKFIAGEDCGCDERKETLNKLFPFKKKRECLTEEEYNQLSDVFDAIEKRGNQVVKRAEQMIVNTIHSRVFGSRNEPTSCGPCFKATYNELKLLHEQYK
jgi:hypothetical protein